MAYISDIDFLEATGLFFTAEDVDTGVIVPTGGLAINLNDAWYWATSDFEPVAPEHLREVREMFQRWGRYGLEYWAWKRSGYPGIEFKDKQRILAFIRQEEDLRESEPNSSKRAYMDIPKQEDTSG